MSFVRFFSRGFNSFRSIIHCVLNLIFIFVAEYRKLIDFTWFQFIFNLLIVKSTLFHVRV